MVGMFFSSSVVSPVNRFACHKRTHRSLGTDCHSARGDGDRVTTRCWAATDVNRRSLGIDALARSGGTTKVVVFHPDNRLPSRAPAYDLAVVVAQPPICRAPCSPVTSFGIQRSSLYRSEATFVKIRGQWRLDRAPKTTSRGLDASFSRNKMLQLLSRTVRLQSVCLYYACMQPKSRVLGRLNQRNPWLHAVVARSGHASTHCRPFLLGIQKL